MPVSLEEFCRQASEIGLLSQSELSHAQDTVGSSASKEAARAFAMNLVRQKKVTVYQAQQLYNGNGATLTLGNYLILEKIGQGGMGMVFKALHRRMDRLVAVKVLPPSIVKSSSSIQRFQREVRAAAKLDHPNIVAAYDADEHGGTHFLVMQFVDGKDLSAQVREEGRLPIAKAIDYIEQAAKGLAYAHAKNVIHRDIKPANLLLGRDGVVRVLDLGLARIQGDKPNLDDQLTQSGHIMGTVDYMAPEQALNTREADARADIYSLGSTFWYLLTAESLYPGDSMVQKLVAHQNAPLRVLSEVRPDVASEVDVWLQRMIAKSPDDRFQSMDEVIHSLSDLRKHSNAIGNIGSPLSATDKSKLESATSPVTIKLDQSLIDTASQSVASFQIKTSPQIPTVAKSGKSAPRAKPSRQESRRRIWWLAAASLPLLVIATIVVIIRHGDGTETRIEIPEGSTVEIAENPQPRPPSGQAIAAAVAPSSPAPTQPLRASESNRNFWLQAAPSSPTTTQPLSPSAGAALPSSVLPTSAWEDLFSGRDTTAWSTLGSFRVQDDLLVANGGRENAISKDQYTDFELEAVWKIGAGANSGIYYRNDFDQAVSAGNEYQIADHKSNPTIYPPQNQTGSLYGLIAPSEDLMNPPGQWNTTRIVCLGTKTEHWLNQRKVLEYDTASESFRTLIRDSKFSGKDSIGNHQSNFLLLQSVIGDVSFRSIRIRKLAR